MDPAIFWSSRAQKSPFWPPSVKLAPKFFPPINFWFFQWKSINYISISSQFSGKFAIWPFRGQTSYLILGIFQLVKNPLFQHLIFILFYWSNSFTPKFISLTKIFWIGLLFDPSQARILPKDTHFSTETPFNDVSVNSKEWNFMITTLYITYSLWRRLYQFF